MNDRELLELAAKAYGFGSKHKATGEIQFCWTESEYPPKSGKHGALWSYVGYMDTAELWNPLTDDGDALQLAVKLDIFATPVFFHYRSLERFGRQDADDVTATRRAIVRAAAEIARAAA